MSTPQMTRRKALLSGLFGSGCIGLRALATGLPIWYLLDPSKANADNLVCNVNAATTSNLQYLIVSTSFNGDPLNCNCPGTYEPTGIIHPQQAEVAATQIQLGSKTYGAALPWAPTTAGGALNASVLARTSFFHHSTQTTVHGDQPKVMKILGDLNNGEMLVSALAQQLAPCLNTVQHQPIAVGAGNNSSELVSYDGISLASLSPLQLKQLLTGSTTDPLVKMRSLRDSSLSQLNALAKQDATGVQSQFLDALALSQTQVRALAQQLATTLSAIKDNSVNGQALAAAALIAANVTSVVTMHIPFGGDNHADQNLQAEADQTVSGVQGIQAVMTALANLNLTDKVTFATLNVFGRNLNGLTKVTDRAGRDHFGDHNVMVMIGKNVAPSVIGGPVPDSNGNYVASDIDSATGAAVTGGDIPVADSLVSAGRTLGAALGLPDSVVNSMFISSAGGAIVPAALV